MSTFLTDTNRAKGKLWISGVSYILLTLALIFFPLGGILGDVCCGRYKTVVSGLALTAVSAFAGMAASMLTFKEDWSENADIYRLVAALIVVTFVLFVLGFSVFASNVMQFGLDQLMEKPSESLGVFVHWFVWAGKLGAVATDLFDSFVKCLQAELQQWITHSTWILPFLSLIASLAIAYCTRRHFNRDRVKYNPYKMIFKVLNFARKNKYPVGPVSAFAHCYDYRPSRLDYAKERYGGPFTTSDVEDVKAFKNVFLVLLALGPVFTLDVPASEFMFNLLSNHVQNGFVSSTNKSCGLNFGVGNIASFVDMILFPLYIWLIYSILRNRPIKIFHRLTFGVILYILSIVSMLVIDLAGHTTLKAFSNQAQPRCMFLVNEKHLETTLNLHWVVLIFPGIAKGFSEAIIMATSFEFISAQSPHTMKGILVGTVFALDGTFCIIGCLILLPFSVEQIWKHGYLGQHPPVVSCGFGYYLVCITVAMIGFISFIVAVKRYKYRRRDEEPYSQACVEEIFARRIESSRNYYRGYEELQGTNEY